MRAADRARGHRLVEHTADVGIEAWGDDLAAAFAEAARALTGLMVDVDAVEERVMRGIALDATDPEDLLARWLNELIYLAEAEGLVFRRTEVRTLTPRSLEAVAWGEPLDPARHRPAAAPKAATYHDIAVEAGPPARVRVIVDV